MTNIASALDKAHVYNDLSGLHELRSAQGTEAEKVQATAKQFESMMLNLMLKTMRKANEVFAEGNMLNSHSTRFYEDMLDQQLTLSMTRGDGVGLAEMLATQLTQDYATPPLPSYRTLADYPRHSTLSEAVSLPDGVVLRANRAISDKSTMVDQSAMTDVRVLSAAEANILADVESITADLFTPGNSVAENGIYSPNEASSADKSLVNPVLPVTKQFLPDNEPLLPDSEPLQFSNPRNFSEVLFPAAQRVANALGVDPRLLLAQAALETGWGKHMITDNGKPSFNLFGIKADSRWQGDVVKVTTTEYRQGIKLKEQAEFRSYHSYEESFKDYLQFLQSNSRYQDALARHAEPKAFAQALQSAGYATDPQYAHKIVRIYQQMGGYSDNDKSALVNENSIPVNDESKSVWIDNKPAKDDGEATGGLAFPTAKDEGD